MEFILIKYLCKAVDKYFQILGLASNASNAQIKKAYRKLALQYHPDINKSEDAQERFLKVTEAYEVLTDSRRFNNPFKRYSSRKSYSYNVSKRRQTAQERAQRQANMQYEEFCKNNEAFQKSWYYRPTQVLVLIIYLFGWGLGFFLMATPLLVSFYIHMKGGFWWQGILCMPLILAGLLIIHQSIRLKKEASLYFKHQPSAKEL